MVSSTSSSPELATLNVGATDILADILSRAGHTLGPWQWDGYALAPVDRDYKQHAVHTIMFVEYFATGFLGSERDAVSKEDDANRALLAAAPDLFEAACAATRIFARQKWRLEGTDPEAVALAKLLAALAKATGSAA